MGKDGYRSEPWIFKGDALYQINLVKVEEARKHIPPELKLVEFGGWTLGGLYLARYSDSPAGVFDELVVLGGLVWNAPTSCAWASRVYVNSKSARDHGLKVIGLPSRLATFSQSPTPTKTPRRTLWQKLTGSSPPAPQTSWWNADFAPHNGGCEGCHVTVKNAERGARGFHLPVAEMFLPAKHSGRPGPRINMTLPSYSGRTQDCPDILHYVCNLNTRVRLIPEITHRAAGPAATETPHPEDMSYILAGKPLVALAFDDMTMSVPKPRTFLA